MLSQALARFARGAWLSVSLPMLIKLYHRTRLKSNPKGHAEIVLMFFDIVAQIFVLFGLVIY